MQDLPRLFTNNEKVGFTSLNRPGVRQYSPVKNQTAEAAKKQQAGLDPAAAASGVSLLTCTSHLSLAACNAVSHSHFSLPLSPLPPTSHFQFVRRDRRLQIPL